MVKWNVHYHNIKTKQNKKHISATATVHSFTNSFILDILNVFMRNFNEQCVQMLRLENWFETDRPIMRMQASDV